MFKHSLRAVVSAVFVAALALSTFSAPAVQASTYSDGYARQVFDLMNARRAAAGIAPLRWNQAIAGVSQEWAGNLGVATMDSSFSFANLHRSDAGGSEIPPGAAWYREIIGFNFSPADVVNWWMASPAHHDAMLSASATDAGIGYVVPVSGPYAGFHLVVSNLAGYSPPAASPLIAGPIRDAWIQAGSGAGILGYPTGPQVCGIRNGGCYQSFQGGQIHWSPATGAHITRAGIGALWAAQGWENGSLGYPTSNEIQGLANGGSFQSFQGGRIHWSPATGAHVTRGAIGAAWAAQGWENGRLGYPLGEEYPLRSGGVAQDYQGGRITWLPAAGAHATAGPVGAAWSSQGGEDGPLGFPTSDEAGGPAKGGSSQRFQGGRITWSAATGARTTTGVIGALWDSQGRESGWLGFPTSDEVAGLADGGTYQAFQGGQIHWSPATGAHITGGAIDSAWAAQGWENGPLGYPISDEVKPLANGGAYQGFHGGQIYWSRTTGAHITRGAIGAAWAAQGWENGPLGYPIGEEYQTGNGAVAQNYQGGRIGWSPAAGSKVVVGMTP